MHNALGQVHLARREWLQAEEELTLSLQISKGRAGWQRIVGYALKDRALACLGQGKLDEAEGLARQAEEFLTSPETHAHLQRTWGLIKGNRRQYAEAAQCSFETALDWFAGHQDRAEAARTQLELARGSARPLTPSCPT